MKNYGNTCKVQEFESNGAIESDTDVAIYTGANAGLLGLPANAKNGHRILVKNLGGNTSLTVLDGLERIVNYNTSVKSDSVVVGRRATMFRFVKTESVGDVWLLESYY